MGALVGLQNIVQLAVIRAAANHDWFNAVQPESPFEGAWR